MNDEITVVVENETITLTVQDTDPIVFAEIAQQGPEGPKGDKGDTEYVGNIDGGYPDSIYGGIPLIDGGGI